MRSDENKDVAGRPSACGIESVCCSNTRKSQSQTRFALQTKDPCLSEEKRGGKVGGVRGGALPAVSGRGCREPHLDKSFVSAEGWDTRLCCGFEEQINVRHEVVPQSCEGGAEGHDQ